MRAIVLTVLWLGCGGSEDSPGVVEADSAVVDSAVADSSGSESSSPEDTLVVDSATAADTMALVDTAMESSTVDSAVAETLADTASAMDAAGKKQGQCYTNAQCPSGTCRANAPGGICTCSATMACSSPATFDCNTMFGACVLDCKVDADCIAGMQCTTSGCALKPCTNDASCASTTVCRALGGGSSKYCQRKLCPDGTGCPTGTTCLTSAEAKSCVEDALKF